MGDDGDDESSTVPHVVTYVQEIENTFLSYQVSSQYGSLSRIVDDGGES